MASKKLLIPNLEVSDFYLSAFLMARGARLVSTKRHGTRVTFSFLGGDETNQLVAEWRAMTGTVVAQTFVAAIRNLKDIVHESREV